MTFDSELRLAPNNNGFGGNPLTLISILGVWFCDGTPICLVVSSGKPKEKALFGGGVKSKKDTRTVLQINPKLHYLALTWKLPEGLSPPLPSPTLMRHLRVQLAPGLSVGLQRRQAQPAVVRDVEVDAVQVLVPADGCSASGKI